MPGFSAIAMALGAVTSVAGTVISMSAQSRMSQEQEAASKRAENARQQQSQLDASRRRREAVRSSMLARATALSTGANQGAQFGSGVEGGMAQATATGFQNQSTVTQAEILGGRVFSANRDYASATARGQQGQAFGSGLSSLGNTLMSVSPQIGRLGTYMTTQNPNNVSPQYSRVNKTSTGGFNPTPNWPPVQGF